MQAIGGLQTRGEGETPTAGGVYATLAMAAAARHSPAAPGAAERAHRSRGRRRRRRRPARALAAWRSLGSPAPLPITDELSLVAFGTPPALVVELDHVAPDGAVDQHNHGLRPEAARAFRERIATAPFAWRASAGGFEIVSRTGGGAALRFPTAAGGRDASRCCSTRRARQPCAPPSPTRSSAPARAAEPGRNDPCPCGSGRKYKSCCGRD